MLRVLFVCLGNICRSPMAEGIMRHLVAEAGLSDQIEVDSAGTSGAHDGEQPHPGTLRVLRKHGIELNHASRMFTDADAERFDLLVAMDESNVRAMQTLFRHAAVPQIHFLLDFVPDGPRRRSVPDPWYTGDFDGTYELIDGACRGLLDHIKTSHLPVRARR